METSRKVLTVVLAAEEVGCDELPDPLLQSLVSELMSSDQLTFAQYTFKETAVEVPEFGGYRSYPYSPELDDDLGELVLLGRLDRHWSVETFVPTPRARDEKAVLVSEFVRDEEGWTYDRLVAQVRDHLAYPDVLLERAYDRYLHELASAQ